MVNPSEAVDLTQDQIPRDFAANVPVLRTSIALALKSDFDIELDPAQIDLQFERLSEWDWRTETNLASVTRLSPQQVHDVVGNGLPAACALNERIALMRSFDALSGFQVNELPLFEDKLEFLDQELDPSIQDARFDRLREIAGLPDVSPDLTVRDVDLAKLIEITSDTEVQQFRQWLRTTDSFSDKELAETAHPLRDALAKAVRGRATKAVRLAVTTGVGVLSLPVGIVLSVLDTFVVEKLMPRPGPTAVLSRLSRSVFENR